MESVRFSIIENDLERDERGSISSESSGELSSDHMQVTFHHIDNENLIWDREEIEKSLYSLFNAQNIAYGIKTNLYKGWYMFPKNCQVIISNLFPGSIYNENDVNVALLISVWLGHSDIVLDLLENFNANPNTEDSKGRRPLHLACCVGNVQIVKILLDHEASPNQWDKENKIMPLHCAASCGNVECVMLLLRRKAEVNVGIENRSPLHFAIDSNSVECVEILLKYGANPNTPQVFTETPLHTAAGLGFKDCVKLLLSYGADVRSRFGKKKLTALHLAAKEDYTECAVLLLESGAEIDARNADNQTPLHLACLSQSIETLEMLIKYGANVNAVYKDGRTALHAAIVKHSKCMECVEILLKAGAKVNKADHYGYTPLHISALNEFSSCAFALIENGADVTAKTNGGVSALSFIVRRTPEVIPKLIGKLDSSIKVNDHEIGDVDCEINLDFRLLVPSKDRGETELLLSFIEVGQKRILKHPLCETFLFLKWRRIRKFFLMSLFYHTLFVIVFTLYILEIYVKDCEHIENCKAPLYISPIGYIVIIMNMILLIKEIFQMVHGIYGYIRYWENWLQWIIIFGVFLCVTPETLIVENLISIPDWQHHTAAIIVFLVWLELMMLVGRFPIFGLYVQMFTKVAVNFAKFLLAYCCLLIAFGLSFCVLFTNYPAFENIPLSLLKTVTMMAGELEFEDIFYTEEHKVYYPVTSHIMFFAFVLLVTVILTNLLVGLAGLQDSAGLDRLTRQAELVARLESVFFSRLLRRVPSKILRLCQSSALLRTSRYQLQFKTRPNDPRDRRLPDDLKLSIYKLVAARRDKRQSIRRRKYSENLSFLRTLSRNGESGTLRPHSLSANRGRVVSENLQSKTKNPNSPVENKNDYVNQFIAQIQMKRLSKKVDKLSSNIFRQMSAVSTELEGIKIQLEEVIKGC